MAKKRSKKHNKKIETLEREKRNSCNPIIYESISAVTFGGDSSTAVQFVFRESHPSPKKYLSFSKIDVGFHTAGLCNGKFM